MRVLRSMPSLTRAIGTAMVAAALVAGCSSSAGAGWTYAPAPSVTPPPSGSAAPSSSAGASAAPSSSAGVSPGESATAAPSGSATAAPSSAPSTPASASAPSGTVVKESAEGIAFKDTQLTASAGQAFTIDFDNQDAGIPHNIEIKDAGGTSVFKGEIVTGPIETSYQVGALAAGSYSFMCDVHPNMTGTLTVQ